MDCEPNCLTDMNSYTHFIKRTRRIVMEKTMDKIIAVAKARGCLKKGEELDYEKASRLLLEEFRSGKLGKVTLEFPKGPEEA